MTVLTAGIGRRGGGKQSSSSSSFPSLARQVIVARRRRRLRRRIAPPSSSSSSSSRAAVDRLGARRVPKLTTDVDCVDDFPSSSIIDDDDDDYDDEPCPAGANVVASCDVIVEGDRVVIDPTAGGGSGGGTQGRLSASLNLGKCICGAGSFALPYVFLKEGILGGTLAMALCGYLASRTMISINESRMSVATSGEGTISTPPPSSYVELADIALGELAARAVFALTLAASLGVCSTYVAFVSQTLASLSTDVNSDNVVRMLAPDIDERTWGMIASAFVLPLSYIRNYGAFAFTSALGVFAVLGGMITTISYGVLVDPGEGIAGAILAASHSRMWPISFKDAFGGSFGTIAYLFCVNFLTFPIINSMKDPGTDYDDAVSMAVAVIWIINVVFAVLCLGFYGDETQDLILRNLGNGPYLSALKLLLCVDLLFTFPVVFSSGRQILENALTPNVHPKSAARDGLQLPAVLSRAAITAGAVAVCFSLSQLGGFGVVVNLVGGVAQGSLAFILPPAISIALSRRRRKDTGFDVDEIPECVRGDHIAEAGGEDSAGGYTVQSFGAANGTMKK
ncbi:hypothetical protein ACHAXA_010694 [Cyclostephanos tholiformis]|uniref:Amino acid transporter transmembrane domain-containing protein n=1 Tax=Cyclostephanos tholiformis TaxID=382380 RepID=A0ABD3SET1_9STRA